MSNSKYTALNSKKGSVENLAGILIEKRIRRVALRGYALRGGRRNRRVPRAA